MKIRRVYLTKPIRFKKKNDFKTETFLYEKKSVANCIRTCC